jgi:murein tripeptide amidase MpaA
MRRLVISAALARAAVFLALAAAWSSAATAQTAPKKWLTDYELSGRTRTPRYAETMAYARRLEQASPWIRVESFGRSPEGRDLPLIIVSKDRAFTPKAAAKSGKAVVLVQNGIHAGEIDGKDACLMLLRDMAITKSKASLLDHVILLVIPIYNVDGHERFGRYNRINQSGPEEMGWRVTAQNLNLNRDYMKADAPETQAWLRLFNAWMPDFFIDAHVTDGADYQHVATYSIESHDNVAAPVRAWIRDRYLPNVMPAQTHDGVTAVPYLFLKDDKDPLQGLMGGTASPRFSTVYTTLHNRPGLLIETHMMKDYRTRVEATGRLIEGTLRFLQKDADALRAAVRRADEETAAGLGAEFPLRYELVMAPNDSLRYMGYRQRNQESDISGKTWIVYTKEPFEATVPRYDSVKAALSVVPPAAYLIPAEWQGVIERLKMHGVALERLTAPVETDVELYRFSGPKWQQEPFEGRHPVSYTATAFRQKRTYPKGTVLARVHQKSARVLLHLLEPQAPDAFAAWGFFDAVFEQKEYAEDYVMEPIAREMLAHDPQLKKEFEQKLAADTAFARDPSARLNYFYQRSPYWDPQVLVYPVARVLEPAAWPSEPLR